MRCLSKFIRARTSQRDSHVGDIRSLLLFIALVTFACQSEPTKIYPVVPTPRDGHTFSNYETIRHSHLRLDLTVNFRSQILEGLCTYDLERSQEAEELVLDTKGLTIDSIWTIGADGKNASLDYTLGVADDILGAPLHISLPSAIHQVSIAYKTHPDADALLWMDDPSPFLFSQSQAILARSWVPCQDSPGLRFTYEASVNVPPGLMAVMSAENPQDKNDSGQYRFVMNQPIPAYLLALAVGDLTFKKIDDRIGVYATPDMIDASVKEFADLDVMLDAAESMYGSYLWDRYDVLVLPSSFPFGGMENPRLTFVTPTIIAGDRSLTSLLAHELAHSWSGNLVTNATWNDFWLNEGFTVYVERRIMESLYGIEYAEMLAELGFEDLMNTMNQLSDSTISRLALQLNGKDPDLGMNDIAYEKGYLLLRTLEQEVGRPVFDQYIKRYFLAHQFGSISTEQWIVYTEQHLLDSLQISFDLEEWIYGNHIPSQASIPDSRRLQTTDRLTRTFVRVGRLDVSSTRKWSAHEWLRFVRGLPHDLHHSLYQKIEDVFRLSQTQNSEVLAAWLEVCIRSGFLNRQRELVLRDFLTEVGRRKFLVPLYRALMESENEKLAREIFRRASPNYHSIAHHSIQQLLED